MEQKTLLILKPDIFWPESKRLGNSSLTKELGEDGSNFITDVKSRLEYLGLKIEKEEKVELDNDTVGIHYLEHMNNPDKFLFLSGYITDGPLVRMIVSGELAITKTRAMIMQIREEYLEDPIGAWQNMTHASDSIESAQREIELHFNK